MVAATDWEREAEEETKEAEPEEEVDFFSFVVVVVFGSAAEETERALSSFAASESSISLTEDTNKAAVELCCSSDDDEEEAKRAAAPGAAEGEPEALLSSAEPFLEERPDDDAEFAEVEVEEEGLPDPSPRSAVPPLASRISEAWDKREGTSGTGTAEAVRGIEEEG